MKRIDFCELPFVDFDVKGIKASNAAFVTNTDVDYMIEGRQRYLIHILTDGTRLYKTKNESVTVSSGTLMFLPHGTKYYTKALDVGKTYCKGLSVIFDLVDQDGNMVELENNTLHIRHDTRGVLLKRCEAMLKCTLEKPDNILEIKSLLLRLISEIVSDPKKIPPAELAPAFDMLTIRYKENLSVKEYADRCHLSESYFRKKFTDFAGKSPIQYRNELRFAEARRLYSEGATVNEIANELGFFDAGYFSKMYKKFNGHTLRSESDKDII